MGGRAGLSFSILERVRLLIGLPNPNYAIFDGCTLCTEPMVLMYTCIHRNNIAYTQIIIFVCVDLCDCNRCDCDGNGLICFVLEN